MPEIKKVQVGNVYLNGVRDFSATNVVKIAYVYGKVWYLNSDDLWFYKGTNDLEWLPEGGTYDSPLLETLLPKVVITETVLPGAVMPLITNVTPTGVTIYWTAPEGTQPIFYQVQYRQSGSNTWINVGSQTAATSVTITNLTPNNLYEIQVITSNAAGTSTTLPIIIPFQTAFGATIPGNVTPVVTTITPNSIVISWNAPTGTAPFTYQVFYKKHTDSSYTSLPSVSALNEGVINLIPNTAYDFYVIATNSVGNSVSPIVVGGTTTSLAVGSVGTPSITGVTQTTLTITWNTPTGTAPFTYKVYKRISGSVNWDLVTSTTLLSVNVTGLSPQTSYEFEVIPSDAVAASLVAPTIVSVSTGSIIIDPQPIVLAASAVSRVTATSNLTIQSLATRIWYENPGEDGMFWVQPFKTTANWITSGSILTQLRNGSNGGPTGHVHLKGDYCVPWVIGRATDPLVTVRLADGTKTIQVHIPLGTVIEEPASQFDSSIGGCDVTKPYLVWNISGATMNTSGVQASGTIITGSYGLQIDDGAGQLMMDAVTGQFGTNNSIGQIQDFELNLARANPNYVIQHMLAYELDPSQVNRSLVWPLKEVDTSFANTGSVPQGVTIGIPSTTARPSGKSRGWYLLFDNLQQYGWFYYNVSGNNCLSMQCYSTNSANSALVTEISNSISDVMQYVCMLNYTPGVTGAQYNLTTQKGMAPGGVNAYTAPPLLDLSPTGGVNVAPSTFGAWYPSGYNRIPVGGSSGGVVLPTESAQGTVTTAIGSPIYNSLLEKFTINSNAKIAVNDIEDSTTAQATTLLYFNHVVWHKNQTDWYSKVKASDDWAGPFTDPRIVGINESPSGTEITAINTPIYNTALEAFTITSGGKIAVNGVDDNTTSGATVLLYYNHTVWHKNATDWYSKVLSTDTWGGPFTDPRIVAPATGAFTISNGQIIHPNGGTFIARGINLYEFDVNKAVTNTACQPLLTLLPGLNALRIPVYSYLAPSTWATFVQRVTALGIVVCFEHHIGAGGPLPATGQALIDESNWYASLATYYKSNPYVWFGTVNEPSGANGGGAVSAQHLATYQAIRNTGNTAPIWMSCVGGGDPNYLGTNGGLTVSVYAQMANVMWDCHQYNWISGYSTNYNTILNKMNADFAKAQTITCANGIMPIIIGEYGPATNGNNDDPGGEQEVDAVHASGKSTFAWNWASGAPADNVTDGNNNLTSFGQKVAAYLFANRVVGPNRVVAPLTGNIGTGGWVAKDITVPGVTLPSGKQVHFEYLLPANYNSSVVYPVLVWLHPNMEGNPWYNNSNTNPNFLSAFDANGWYNTVNFRTNYPCIVVVGYADQTTDNVGGALQNWGGWTNTGVTGTGTTFSGDTGPNVFGLLGVINWVKTNLSADATRVYVSGFSLGGHGSMYAMLKYNRINGSQKVFTAATEIAGVLQINGFGVGPNSANVTTMANVPVWWVAGGQDGTSIPEHWALPMWRQLAGNSNYPAPGTSATAAKAGNSQYRLWLDPNIGHQQTNSSGAPYPINTTILNWLFSQIIN